MSVNLYTYGTVKGVWRRIGWLNAGRMNFDGSTQPTLEQVEIALDQVASIIHARLTGAGYPASLKTDITTNAPRVSSWLERMNEDGAASDLLMTNPMAMDPDSAVNPGKHWEKRFSEGLKLIDGPFLSDLGLARTNASSECLRSGSLENTDGETKLPIFTREMFDYPGSRSLTED